MKKTFLVWVLLSLTAFLSAQQTVRLSSLEWAPFSGAALRDQGASIAVAKAAFKAEGYDLVVDFVPWERAVSLAKTDPNYAGYYPEYYSDDNAKEFLYSDPVGQSPIGFAERKDSPMEWKTLDDLKPFKVGTVEGYVNTAEFDKMAADKTLKVIPALDDLTNLKILFSSKDRLKTAVIDRNVFEYYVKTSPELKGASAVLTFNSKVLDSKKLYVCFKKDAHGAALAKIFNKGLKKINADKMLADSLSSFLK